MPQVQYIGRFTDYLYDNNGYPLGDGLANPGTIVNLTVNYTISPKYSVFAYAKNLLNSSFEPVNSLQIPGQSFIIGIKGNFGI